MSEQDYTTTITSGLSRRDVYDAAADPRRWWSETITGVTDAVGGVFEYDVPGIHYSMVEVTELVPGVRIVWRVREATLSFVTDQHEWEGTEIRFDIDERDGATELRFTHVGLVPSAECYEACYDGWSFYIGTSLRGLLETGTGEPNRLPAEVRLLEEQASAGGA
jgi:hypothetical protein